jgi:AraC-like DNA-binding protein
MSQPLLSRQPKHGVARTIVAAVDEAADFRSSVALASIVPFPKGSDHAAIVRRDDGPIQDATTIAFERLGLVIAIETNQRHGAVMSPNDPAPDICCLRVEIPPQCGFGAVLNPTTKVPGCNEDDPVVRRLSEALSVVETLQPAHRAICADALRFAAVARLFALQPDMRLQLSERVRAGQCTSDKPIQGLQKWRLKRVLDYIEAHFGDRIPLADLAAVAGLSRMHFAAQFRAATGFRPHEYIVRHRIQRSKGLLRSRAMSIVEIALTVGFQSQAHFTTTFRRFVGYTPSRWRDAVTAGLDL